MPRKATKKAAKKKASGKARPMSQAHKKALAEGRRNSATVDAYLRAINTPKTRGRQVSVATLRSRLGVAKERAKSSVGVDRVLAAQEVRDIEAKLASSGSATTDVKALERGFVRVAKQYSSSKGITYGAWRDAGVSAPVLKRAGIARTRG